jgi:hypothetical protein
VSELEKKERQDKKQVKDKALKFLSDIFNKLTEKGEIQRRSHWREWRTQMLELLTNTPELRALDETAVCDAFNVHIKKLGEEFDANLKSKKKELDKYIEGLMYQAPEALREAWKITHGTEGLEASTDPEANPNLAPVLTIDTSYADALQLPAIKDHPIVVELLSFTSTGPSDVYRNVQLRCKERFRDDQRLVRDALKELRLDVYHDSRLEDIRDALVKFAGLTQPQASEDGELADKNGKDKHLSEAADRGASGGMAAAVKGLLMYRPNNLASIFTDLQQAAQVRHQETLARKRRDEERFISLLQRYFYRSDHVDITWDEAKNDLRDHTAYDALDKSDRIRIFDLYMETLRRKLFEKQESMKRALLRSESSYQVAKKDDELSDGEIDESVPSRPSLAAPLVAGGSKASTEGKEPKDTESKRTDAADRSNSAAAVVSGGSSTSVSSTLVGAGAGAAAVSGSKRTRARSGSAESVDTDDESNREADSDSSSDSDSDGEEEDEEPGEISSKKRVREGRDGRKDKDKEKDKKSKHHKKEKKHKKVFPVFVASS